MDGTYLKEPHANRDNAQSAPAVRLYRFYNLRSAEYGDVIAMCDRHRATAKVPDICHLEKIADAAVAPCLVCEDPDRPKEPS